MKNDKCRSWRARHRFAQEAKQLRLGDGLPIENHDMQFYSFVVLSVLFHSGRHALLQCRMRRHGSFDFRKRDAHSTQLDGAIAPA